MNNETMSKRASIAALLRHPQRKVRSAKTIFCTIFRQMLIERDVDLARFHILTSVWRKRITKFRKLSNAKVSSDVSNLHKELDRDTMTPETFIKACQFMGAVSVEFMARVGFPTKNKNDEKTLVLKFHNVDQRAYDKLEKILAKEGIKIDHYDFEPQGLETYSMKITDVDEFLESSKQNKSRPSKKKKGGEDGKSSNSDSSGE